VTIGKRKENKEKDIGSNVSAEKEDSFATPNKT